MLTGIAALLLLFFWGLSRWGSTTAVETEAAAPSRAETPPKTIERALPPSSLDTPDCAIHGVVSMENDAGLAGAEICVMPLVPHPTKTGTFTRHNSRNSAKKICVLTDDKGAYVLSGLFQGELPLLSASAEGYLVKGDDGIRSPKPLRPKENRVINFQATQGVLLKVRVEDQGAGPIVGAKVYGRNNDYRGGDCAKGTSNKEGIAKLYCHPGDYRISSEPDGYSSAEVDANAPGKALLILKPAASISGRVTSDLEAALPVMTLEAHSKALYTKPTQSTRDGLFTIKSLKPGEYSLLAKGGGYFGVLDLPIVLAEGQALTGVEIKVRRGTPVTITLVRDDKSSCEAPRAWLKSKGKNRSTWWKSGAADEALHFSGVPPGRYEAEAVCNEGENILSQGEVTVGEEALELRYTLPAARPVRGRVLNAQGEPVAKAHITPWYKGDIDRSTDTDAQGNFSFNYRPGHWRIEVDHPDYLSVERELDLNELPTEPLKFVLEEGLTLVGQTINQDGIAVPGALVQSKDHKYEAQKVTSDAQGRFTLRGLRKGRLKLWAELGSARSEPKRISIPSSANLVTLKLIAPKGQIQGQVLSFDNQPVERAKVSLVADEKFKLMNGPAEKTAVTDTGGFFIFESLDARSFSLLAEHPEHGQGVVRGVRASEKPKIKLMGQAEVSGYVVDERGRKVERFELLAQYDFGLAGPKKTFTDGRYILHAIPAGQVRLAAYAGDQRGSLQINLRPGDKRSDLKIQLSSSALAGQLLEGGKPVPNEHLEFRCLWDPWNQRGQWRVQTDQEGRFSLAPFPICDMHVEFPLGFFDYKICNPMVARPTKEPLKLQLEGCVDYEPKLRHILDQLLVGAPNGSEIVGQFIAETKDPQVARTMLKIYLSSKMEVMRMMRELSKQSQSPASED